MALPMPPPTNPPLPLPSYKLLTFDVYGTLIEYKSHILASFTPLLSRLPPDSPYLASSPLSPSIPGCATTGQIAFLKLFQRTEDAIKLERPPLRFDALLAELWRRVAAALSVPTTPAEAAAFGSAATVASWPAFPGTADALRSLARRFRLVALSNIDAYAWGITAGADGALAGVGWERVFTAEEFEGDPEDADEAKLRKVLGWAEQTKGWRREEVLHVAQSLGHDHAPAKRLGVSSVFLVGDGSRWGKGEESRMVLEKGLVGYAWRCQDLREFAQVVEEAFRERDG